MILFSVYLFLVFIIILPDTAYSGQQFIIKFATVAPEGSIWMKHMRRLDKKLREKSDGQLSFKLYAGGIAGDELDMLRKIRIGQIHCAGFSGVGIAKILPMVRVLDLPFLFRDYQETDLVHNELKGFFAENFKKKGFEFLSWAEVGNVHLFSKRPVRKISDLAGLKIWTWSGDPISKETFSIMGTNPIPLAITDVTTALNTGMIDTVYAPPLGALALQWHTYTKYMTSLPLTHATGAVLISKSFYKKIPSNLSDMIKKEFKQSMTELTTDLRNQAIDSVRLIEKSGIKIIPMPSEADLKDFHRVHDQVAQRLTSRIYPKKLLDRVYEILKRD